MANTAQPARGYLPLPPKKNDPHAGGQTVTTSDTIDFHALTRAVYVGGAGTIVARMADGMTLTFVGAPVGTVLPISVAGINATGTTATNLVALW